MINAIPKNRCELDFGDVVFDYYCFKITDNYLHFYASIEENEIVPVVEIEKKIKDKFEFNIEISILDRSGEVLNCIFLEGVKLLKIKNLIDFDYNSDDILNIKVKYKCRNIKIFKTVSEIQKYKRKLKLSKINEISIG
jgi:hypothetical protein